MNIGEALLHNPKDGELHLLGHARKLLRDVELCIDLAAFGESFNIAAKRRCKTCSIQQGRMQQMGNSTNLLTSLPGHGSIFIEDFSPARPSPGRSGRTP